METAACGLQGPGHRFRYRRAIEGVHRSPQGRDTSRESLRRLARFMKVVEKTQILKMFVGGRWVDSESGQTFEAVSPATGEVIATLPKGNPADAAHAVEAAHQARAAMAGGGGPHPAPPPHPGGGGEGR